MAALTPKDENTFNNIGTCRRGEMSGARAGGSGPALLLLLAVGPPKCSKGLNGVY